MPDTPIGRSGTRCGEDLIPVRRGRYLSGAAPDGAEARHLLLVRAEHGCLDPTAVLSHVSAAVIHGLPVWAISLGRVHVTRYRDHGGRRGTRAHVHVAPLHPDDVEIVDGLPVTSVARTVVDLARTVPFEQAVAVADTALHAEIVDRTGLDEAVARAKGWPGAPAARRVVAFADGRSASVGESRSRVAIARAGLPTPELQWPVYASDGRHIGDVDFAWRKQRTVSEFDGKVKYGRLLKPGQNPGDVVFAEKVREDALRAEDLGVVRWTWTDLDRFAAVAQRLRRRLL